ncbi:MAG TPA: hypothetical protein ENJ93_02410 [Chloroflexi bacterium]|nr:hypothetical protein [Chloroflexota bacterium]
MDTIVKQINQQVKAFPDKLQWEVLKFVQSLTPSAQRGIPGKHLLKFAGVIPPADLDIMRQAIETGCEQVDSDERTAYT